MLGIRRYELPRTSKQHAPVPLVGFGWQYSAMTPYTFGYTGLYIWTASLNRWYLYLWAGMVAPECTVDVIFLLRKRKEFLRAFLSTTKCLVLANSSSLRFDLVASRSMSASLVKTNVNSWPMADPHVPIANEPGQKGANRFGNPVQSNRLIGRQGGSTGGKDDHRSLLPRTNVQYLSERKQAIMDKLGPKRPRTSEDCRWVSQRGRSSYDRDIFRISRRTIIWVRGRQIVCSAEERNRCRFVVQAKTTVEATAWHNVSNQQRSKHVHEALLERYNTR